MYLKIPLTSFFICYKKILYLFLIQNSRTKKETPEEKEFLWENSSNHFIGKHNDYVYPNDKAVYPGRGCPKKKRSDDQPYWEWQEGKENSDFVKKNRHIFNQNCRHCAKDRNC